FEAAVRAFRGFDAQRAAVPVWQRRCRAVRIRHGFTAAFKTMGDGIEDKHGGSSRGSEIEAAIGQVKAFVADREIRNGLSTQREGDPNPVVERRIDDLVT